MATHPRAFLSALFLVLGPASLIPAQATEAKGPPADARGDALPPGALVRLGTVRFHDPDGILSVAFSPDGKTLASASSSGTVRLWDAANGRRLLELPKGGGTLVLFTPDGKGLICDGSEPGLTLRDPATGRVVRTFGEAPRYRRLKYGLPGDHCVALSSDGKTLAETDDNDAVLWDMATGKKFQRLKGSDTPLASIAFSPDGKTVAAGNTSGMATGGGAADVLLWDVTTGKMAHRFAKVHESRTDAVAFSPDGKTLVSVSPYDTCLWDLGKLELRAKLKAEGSAVGGRSITFLPDGRLLAAASCWNGEERGLMLHSWDPPDEKGPATPRGFAIIGRCLAVAPDGKTLASGDSAGMIRLWDAAAGREVVLNEGHQDEIRSVAFSPDGTLAATASGAEHSIRVWNTASAAQLVKMDIPCDFRCWICRTGHGNTLVFDPDGKTLACDDQVYEVSTGRIVTALPGKILAHSADGALLAGLSADSHAAREGRILVWERAGGREVAAFTPFTEEESFNAEFTCAAFSPDSRFLAVGAKSRSGAVRYNVGDTVYLWDLTTRKLMRRFRPHVWAPRSLAFSPDGELLLTSATWDQPVQLWRVADGEEVRALKGDEETRHWSEFRPAVFSPDGKLIAAGGKDDGVVLWEVSTGQEVRHLAGHEGQVRALRFSPDGRILLSGAADATALIWKLAPPTEMADLSPADLDHLWDQLADEDAAAAYSAAWAIVAAPDKALGLFKKQLKPAPEPNLTRVPRLLKDLDADDFESRQAAYRELNKLGPAAADALRQALGGEPSPEVRKSVELLLGEVHQNPTPLAELRQLRAIQALEWIGTPDAAALLEPLARGSPALRPTRDAEAALRRLSARQPKPVAEKPATPPRSEPCPVAAPRSLSDLKAEATALAYTADGKVLAATAADGTVRLLDAVAGKTLLRFKGDEQSVCAAAFSPDGKTLATGGWDHKIHLWDAKTGEPLKTLEGHTDAVSSVAFAPDGKTLASGGFDKTVRLWDAATGQMLREMEGHAGRVTSVAFAPDGKTLASGDLDFGVNTVAGVPLTIHWSDSVRLWDAVAGRELRRMPGAGQQIAFSPDGKHLATAELETELHVGQGMLIRRSYDGTIGPGMGDPVVRGCVTITVWDTESGQSEFRLTGCGTAIAFSPDGCFLATAAGSDFAEGGEVLKPLHVVPVDGRLRLWEIATGQEVLAFPADARGAVLAFSPDGRSLAAGTKEGGVLVYDLAPAGKDEKPADLRGDDFDRLWAALAGEDAAAAYRARWTLRAADGKGVRFLAERLRPPPADDPELRRLIADLGAETFAAREAAFKALERRGPDAAPALCQGLLQAPSAAVRRRIMTLLDGPGIVRYSDALARDRALAALESVGSAEAREWLETLARGSPQVQQTQTARAALERLDRRGGEK